MSNWRNFNWTTSDIKYQAAVWTASCYSKHVSTLIPTSDQSKLFIVGVQTSQSSETNTKLAIRPKKIVSSMLDLIHVIHENKYVHSLCPFFTQWTQWGKLWYNSPSPPHPIALTIDRILDAVFKYVQFFFAFLMSNFMFKLLVGRNFCKKIYRHY